MSKSGKRRKKKVKKYLILLISVLIFILVGTIGLGILNKKHMEEQAKSDVVAEVGENSSTGVITYGGKKYKYNDHLSNFLFMGVDTREKVETTKGEANAGQADAIFLLSWDRVEHKMCMVSIPRDTITEIEVFDQEGNSLGMTKDHINLAYAYGDGKNISCDLMKQAVSGLLYGLPIQGYCSLNMDGIPILIEAVGGVNVTVPNNSLSEQNPEWIKGAEIELTAENAEDFVRYRDIEETQSAIERQERQIAFLSAYGEKATQVYSEMPSLVTELYEALDSYMVTNIGADQFVKVLQDFASDEAREIWSIPGEGVKGSEFDKYHVDDEALYKNMIQYFYKEAE